MILVNPDNSFSQLMETLMNIVTNPTNEIQHVIK